MTGRYSSCSASKDYLQGRKAFLERSKAMAARYLMSAIDVFTSSEMALEETNEFAGLIEVHNSDYESGSTGDEIET